MWVFKAVIKKFLSPLLSIFPTKEKESCLYVPADPNNLEEWTKMTRDVKAKDSNS